MEAVQTVLDRMRSIAEKPLEEEEPIYAENQVSQVGFKHLIHDMLYGGVEEKNVTIAKEDFHAVIQHIKEGRPIFGTPKRKANPLTANDGEGISVCTPTFSPVSNQLKNIINKEK